MTGWSRRDFLKTALGVSVLGSWLPRPGVAQEDAASGLVEFGLEAGQQWAELGGRSAYLYQFNGQIPGPVLEASPGDHVRIDFRNSLPENTNLHYHGLHVPPTGNADNSFLSIPSRESFTYEFDLPASHPGGMFWYHPHVHGSAARQVSRGLAGVFIVRGELDQIPEIAAAPEAILVLQDFDLNSAGLPKEPNSTERMMGREGSLVTINGQITPALYIQKDGWLRLRILNASSSRFYWLRLEEHPFYLIGTDGGALPAPEELEEILLAPGERVDAMVEGARPEGSYRLLSLPYNRGGAGMGGSSIETLVLATLIYESQAEYTWRLPQQLVSIDPLPEPSVQRSFLLGQGMGGGMMMGRGMAFTINGRVFNPNRIDTSVQLNAVEEWEFLNTTMMDHPVHIHTNPFQILGTDGTPLRAWKDVALVRAGERVRLRTAFRDFTGSTMYHCHILDHEDLGMMGRLEIQS